MEYGIISCIPIMVLIIGILATKRVAEMMILSSLLAAIFVYKGNFFSGYIDMMYGALSNSSFQFILIILTCFGGMIKLFQKSGALLGFGQILSKHVKSSRKTLLITWAMAFIIFVDDYLNILTASFSMRGITDENRIPREHLAYQVTAMAASLCVLIPFTSWTAFTMGLLSQQGLGFFDYVRGIPFMFYPIITILTCLLVAVGIIPKIGLLKKSYKRVEEGGPVLTEEKNGVSIVDLEMAEDVNPASPLNFIVPVAALITVVFLSGNNLVYGLLAAIAMQGLLYITQKMMTITEFMNHFFEGAKSMMTLDIIMCFAFMLSFANEAMGFSEFLVGGIVRAVPPGMLPALIFITVAFVAFATSGYWIIQIITLPIFIPLAEAVGLDYSIVIGAIMSGAAFGSNFCFYSDTIFMAAAGTGISNVRQIKVAAPYVLGSALLATVCYIIAGFLMV